MDSSQGTKDPRRYVKRELPWPPTAEPENPYLEENEYSYIAEVTMPHSTCAQHQPPEYPPDPPKYFVLDPAVNEVSNGNLPSERYVASTPGEGPKPGLPRRKGTFDEADSMHTCRNTSIQEFGYSYRDDKHRDHNHVSV